MREVSNAEWDDIQDRLREKDAEIEQLKRDNAFYGSNDYVHSLKILLTRAADALETCSPLIGAEEDTDNLIAELRKAAE